jgi:Domain of unknown function (DUF1906)
MSGSRQPRRRPAGRRARGLLAALVALSLCLGALASGTAAQTLRFGGETVRVPPSWPVHRLAEHPRMCVRLDRRAVYLGSPAANQRCPATAAVGRRRAILVDPAAAERARSALPVAPRALASAAGANIFTGLGFDACSAPSSRAMEAWDDSPYRAVGVYIGGENRGCSQPNLTASWVSAQTAAGWHLIPTYVGLQAPTSSCSDCAKLTAAQATAQGAADAADAVADASAVAIGPGSPIYFDMESYSRTSSASAATLAFLEAWTKKLHSLGYVSGVYSSSASGIADLAARLGSGYVLPDQLWIANWNGQRNTLDPVVPASGWASHQRIHQYQGGHDETYGGTTINIDNNYVDASTVGSATLATSSTDPIGHLDLTGAPAPGQVRIRGWAFDPELPTEALTIAVFVGGRAGSPNAVGYDLGPVASSPRADVGALYPTAGTRHGFDLSISTVKSGPQPVCVYAINIGLGTNRLLGCKAITIPVAITLTNVHATRTGVRVRLACEWPTGTFCPGQLALRTRIKVAMPHPRGRPPRIRAVTRSLGRRPFQLVGGRSHAFIVPFSAGGRALLLQRGQLRTQLIAAIPGGKRIAVLGIRP